MPNSKNPGLPAWAEQQIRMMNSLLAQRRDVETRLPEEEEVPPMASAEELEAWVQEDFFRARLAAMAGAFQEAGIRDIGPAEYASLAGPLAGLVEAGFLAGTKYMEDAFVLPNGSDVNVEQRERNAAVLGILNDPAHPRHGVLADFVAAVLEPAGGRS